jgi:hypothetical protein
MRRVLLMVVVALVPLIAFAQSDPLIGTWRLNVAKSKYEPGPPFKSQTIVYAAVPNGLKVTVTGVDGAGKNMSYGYTAYFDGKDYPETGVGMPNGMDTISLKRIDANTTEYVGKKAGKVVQTTKRIVSKDGKILTISATGTNEQGQKTTTTTVYDKQ